MNKFNEIYIKLILLALMLVTLSLWVTFAGPNAFDSGPVGIAVFTFITLALILTIINSGYRIITYKGKSNEVQ